MPEAVRYMLGEPVPKRLVPIWHPESGRPILRLDGSVSDRPFQLRPDFEPPVAPKSGLYATKLLDAEGRARLPCSSATAARLLRPVQAVRTVLPHRKELGGESGGGTAG